MYEELYKENENYRVLCEGAQGFGLDIDWGDYPYVTSSGCTVAAAISNGIPPKRIRNVWGVTKVYETYVGMKKFEPEDPVFNQIREKGAEYGATTGRPRQCNWLNINNFVKAVNMNSTNKVVFNKADILKDVGVWKAYDKDGNLITFESEDSMIKWIMNHLPSEVNQIYWSNSPDKI